MTPITDPRRLLNGFTFAPDLRPSCYVMGCYAGASSTAQHRRFGPVACCAAHHPARAGLEVQAPAAPAVPPPDAHPRAGGAKVPRRPVRPQLPPTPVALPQPARPF